MKRAIYCLFLFFTLQSVSLLAQAPAEQPQQEKKHTPRWIGGGAIVVIIAAVAASRRRKKKKESGQS